MRFDAPTLIDGFFVNTSDETKRLTLNVSAITTLTTRGWTVPDRDIDFTAGGTFQEDISGLTISSATVAGTDKVLIQDVDDSDNLKYVTAQSLADLASVTINNNTNNNILTATGGSDLNGEANLTFDGTTLALTGNMTVTGTVDGRDLSTDGAKLDGIEALADVTDETNVVAALNGATLTGVTVSGTDKVLIQDVDDSDNLKTVTAQAIADLAIGGLEWNEVTGTSQAMSVDNGYVANNASLVTLTLPTTAAFGKRLAVTGKGAGKFRIGQNAGQTIRMFNVSTTTGVGGYVDADDQYGTIELMCITTNTDWIVLYAGGSFTTN